MRVGQICTFHATVSPSGVQAWIGITTSQVFSSQWQGVSSAPLTNHGPANLVGQIAYEVDVKQPVKSDCTTDRDEVRPTGSKVGTVQGGGGEGICFVAIEDWYIESETFRKKGT